MNSYPFRIGTTSHIYPGSLLFNVEKLKDKIEDVELILYETPTLSNLPSDDEIKRLSDTALNADITYTIHLPLDIYLGHADEKIRRDSIDRALRFIRTTSYLNPVAFILHLEYYGYQKIPSGNVRKWKRNIKESCELILQEGVSAKSLCVETLDYPFTWVCEIIDDLKLSVCLDFGHLLVKNYNWTYYMDRYLQRTHIIHLHGFNGNQDHLSLSLFPPEVLSKIIMRLMDFHYSGIVTLEVFSQEDLESSLKVFEQTMKDYFSIPSLARTPLL